MADALREALSVEIEWCERRMTGAALAVLDHDPESVQAHVLLETAACYRNQVDRLRKLLEATP